jgi:hypothetical protein
MRLLSVILFLLLSGCSGIEQVKQPLSGRAFISVPALDSGYGVVSIGAIRQAWNPITQYAPNRNCSGKCAFSLKQGTYVADVTCYRSVRDAVLAPDREGGHYLKFTVRANQTYVLDCEEKPDGSLRFWVSPNGGNLQVPASNL